MVKGISCGTSDSMGAKTNSQKQVTQVIASGHASHAAP